MIFKECLSLMIHEHVCFVARELDVGAHAVVGHQHLGLGLGLAQRFSSTPTLISTTCLSSIVMTKFFRLTEFKIYNLQYAIERKIINDKTTNRTVKRGEWRQQQQQQQ
jgi:predicted secreted protein